MAIKYKWLKEILTEWIQKSIAQGNDRLPSEMELCAKYLKKKLFVLLHQHTLLSAEELASFCKNAMYQKLPLLLIEGSNVPCSPWEKKRVVDVDMCEI